MATLDGTSNAVRCSKADNRNVVALAISAGGSASRNAFVEAGYRLFDAPDTYANFVDTQWIGLNGRPPPTCFCARLFDAYSLHSLNIRLRRGR